MEDHVGDADGADPGERSGTGAWAGSEAEPLRLNRRIVWVWRTPALVTVALFTVVAAVFGALAEVDGVVVYLPALLIAVVGTALAVGVPEVGYRRWRYWVTPEGTEIRHGVWMRVETSIPHFRVQHIDVHQRPLQRLFGVVELRISTASVTSDAQLPGVTRDEAVAIRRLILERALDDDAV